MNKFKQEVLHSLELPDNMYHPLVHIMGNPRIGVDTYIGFYSEINANNAVVEIGDNCDIASFVSINCADSHMKTISKKSTIDRKDIMIGNNVFIGSHSFIGGYIKIGDNCVIGAGTILKNIGEIPPFSLVVGNPPIIKKGYYK